MKLKKQVWFIVGGSSGIGLALSRRVITAGGKVAIFSRNDERLKQAEELLAHDDAQGALATFQMDVVDADQCRWRLAQASERLGTPTVVVNCAGVVWPGYFSHIERAHYEAMFDINVHGAWNVAQAAVPLLQPPNRRMGGVRISGSLVVVSSLAGLLGIFGYSAYAASKYAVIGMCEALRNELRPMGIHVAVVCPPDTDTPQLHEENLIKPPETKVLSEKIKPLTADFVAKRMIAGIRRHRFMIVPDMGSRLIYLVKRLLPGLVYRVMDGDVRKALKKAEAAARH